MTSIILVDILMISWPELMCCWQLTRCLQSYLGCISFGRHWTLSSPFLASIPKILFEIIVLRTKIELLFWLGNGLWHISMLLINHLLKTGISFCLPTFDWSMSSSMPILIMFAWTTFLLRTILSSILREDFHLLLQIHPIFSLDFLLYVILPTDRFFNDLVFATSSTTETFSQASSSSRSVVEQASNQE